jgi:hypothetical protein
LLREYKQFQHYLFSDHKIWRTLPPGYATLKVAEYMLVILYLVTFNFP